eukprot:m.92114 g.92114  ORF g.92114 m.92114 type:complete len:484 (-) comp26523_c0_seq1:141-1592(-)
MFRCARKSKIGLALRTTLPSKHFFSTSAVMHSADVGLLQLTTGISATEYAERRRRLVETLPPKSLAVVLGASKLIMSNDIPYQFRQNSFMRYFSGYCEPDAVLLIASDGDNATSTLVLPSRDLAKEKWDGARTSNETILEEYGIEIVEEIPNLASILETRLAKTEKVFFDQDSVLKGTSTYNTIMKVTSASGLGYNAGLAKHADGLRCFKSEAEVKVMEKACAITSSSFHDAMRCSTSHGGLEHGDGVEEHYLGAVVEFGSRRLGASSLSFPPVVAGGDRANTLHYIQNNNVIRDGDMVLMDAGAEYRGYCGDVSRTWPINGKFSDPQRDIYEAVLRVQLKIIDLLSENYGESLIHLHMHSLDCMAKELLQLGLIEAGTQDKMRQQTRVFYPHSIGHFLGMDVHDTPTQTYATVLQPGMIITIEPGLYIPEHSDVHMQPQYQGIGVRIEDDILLTRDGPVNLTRDCVKNVEDVEQVLQNAADT